MSDVMDHVNGVDAPEVVAGREERMLRAMLSRFADRAELDTELEAAAATGRGADVRAARDRMGWFHRQVSASPFRGEWADVLVARYEAGIADRQVAVLVFDWVAELEGWS